MCVFSDPRPNSFFVHIVEVSVKITEAAAKTAEI